MGWRTTGNINIYEKFEIQLTSEKLSHAHPNDLKFRYILRPPCSLLCTKGDTLVLNIHTCMTYLMRSFLHGT